MMGLYCVLSKILTLQPAFSFIVPRLNDRIGVWETKSMQLCPAACYKVSTSSIVADHFDTTSDKEHGEDVDPTHKKPSLNVTSTFFITHEALWQK